MSSGRKNARRLAEFDQASAQLRETLTPFLAETYLEFERRGIPAPQALGLTKSMLSAMIALSARPKRSTDDADDAL